MHTIQLSIDFIYEHWLNLTISCGTQHTSRPHCCSSTKKHPHFLNRETTNSTRLSLHSSRSALLLFPFALHVQHTVLYRRKARNSRNFINYSVCVYCMYCVCLEYVCTWKITESENALHQFPLWNLQLVNSLNAILFLSFRRSTQTQMHNLSSWKSKLLQFT